MKNHILVINNNLEDIEKIKNILGKVYRITIVKSTQKALEVVKDDTPDLVLVDISLIRISEDEFIKIIKKNKKLYKIPIIFIAASLRYKDEELNMELGAIDFLRKPIESEIMLKIIKLNLELKNYIKDFEYRIHERNNRIEDLKNALILSLYELVECRDSHTGEHVKRTAKYVEILTEELVKEGIFKEILTKEYVKDMIRTALLHDIGKIGIDDATLLKAGSLDSDEFEFMKLHTTLGAKALQKIIDEIKEENKFLNIAKDMAHYHHEKWDGTGYPKGLSKLDIPLCARIMVVGDVYDALTTMRPYKEAFSHEKTVEIILKGKGTSFDPNIIEVFEKIHIKLKVEKEAMNK